MGWAVFPPYSLAWGQTIVGVMAISGHHLQMLMPACHGSEDCCSQCPWPWSRPLSTHAFTRESRTLTGKSGSVSFGVTAPFPWDLVCTRFCCALQESVSLVLWKFCNQIPLAFQVKFPRGSQSLCLIPRLGSLLWALEVLQQQGHILVRQAVGRGHVWWENSSLQECSCHLQMDLPELARTATASVLVHILSHHCPFLCRRPRSISRYVCPNLLCSHLLFSLGPGLHKILCVSSKSGVSVSPSPVEFLQSNLTGLQN